MFGCRNESSENCVIRMRRILVPEVFDYSSRIPNNKSAGFFWKGSTQAGNLNPSIPKILTIGLRSIPPMLIAGYTERHPGYRQTIKQHLTQSRCSSITWSSAKSFRRAPRHLLKDRTHVVKEGKTPILRAEDARKLLDSIPTDSPQGLRARVQTSDDDRPCRNPSYAQPDRRCMRLLKHSSRLLFP